MRRSILPILVGYAVIALCVVATSILMGAVAPAAFPKPGEGRLPAPWLFALMLSLSALYAVVGGYVTARLAPSAPLRHGLYLAVVLLLLGIVNLVVERAIAPLWFLLLTPPAGAAGVLLGAALRARLTAGPATPESA